MERMNDKTKKRLTSALSGALCGILMGTLILYMSLTTGFMIGKIAFWIELVLVCALPMCLCIFRSSGLSVGLAQFCMILVSAVIMAMYAGAMSRSQTLGGQYSNISGTVMVLNVLLHTASLAFVLGCGLFSKWNQKRTKSVK